MTAPVPSPQKRGETTRRRWREDPEWAAEMRRRLSAGWHERFKRDPEFRKKRQAHGSWLASTGKGNACRPAGSPPRVEANRKVRDKRLAWCPEDYRPLYIYLLKKKHVPAAEARRQVEAQMDRDGYPRPIPLPAHPPLPWRDPRAAEIGSAHLAAAFATLAARGAAR
jgi:hypothetical protein